VLNTKGIEVMVLEGVIEDAVTGLFKGEDIRHMTRNSRKHACSGTGGGCG
jgi:nitrogen fixation protein NifB